MRPAFFWRADNSIREGLGSRIGSYGSNKRTMPGSRAWMIRLKYPPIHASSTAAKKDGAGPKHRA
jgi:hypothetical protein